MSIPANSLTLLQWFGLGETLAQAFTDIGHDPNNPSEQRYCRVRFPELPNMEFKHLGSPALLLETPESGGIDKSSSNLLVGKYLAFWVVKRLDEKGDDLERLNAEDHCEEMALQVLAKLRQLRIHLGGPTFGDVQMDGWEGDVGTPFLKPMWAGYRIMVPVQVSEARLKYNPSKWGNMPAPMVDLSRLTCTNLNDPTYGVTYQSLINCLLPRLDFSDLATQAKVTQGQREDLTVWLGGGADELTLNIFLDDVLQETITVSPNDTVNINLI